MTIDSRQRHAIPTLLLMLAVACLLAIVAHQPALAQQSPLSVSGQVVNGSPESGNLVGLAVTLHMQGETLYDSELAITDNDGRFVFDGIVYDPAFVYGVSVRYQDVIYGTEVSLENGAPPPVTIEVYEAVYEQDVIRVGSASLLFADADRVTQTVSALEIIKVINDSGYTFVPGSGGPMSLLRFGLPPGAEGLQVDTRLIGADVVQVDRGFAVIGNVPPGEHDILFTYVFPYDGTETTIEKSFPFGADNLRLLSPNEVLTLASEDIGAPESVDIGERPYQLIETSDIERGRRINVQLSGLPRTTLADRVQGAVTTARYEYVAPALLAVFLAVLIPFAIIRQRSRRVVSGEADDSPSQA